MKAARILQSLATLDRDEVGVMLMNLYRNINRNKIQFDFLMNERTEPYVFEEEIKRMGGRIFTVPKFNGRNLNVYRRKVEQLFRTYSEWKIIHIHNVSSTMLFIDIAKKYRVATIVHAHFDQDPTDFGSYIQRWLGMPIKHNADYLLASSKLVGEHVFGLKKERVSVLKNAIEIERYVFNEETRKRKRAELGLKNETVLGHVGSMVEQKNHTYLLAIFKAYLYLNPRSILLLLGDGELKEKLEQQVAAAGIAKQVKFLGERTDVNEWLQSMDIFVFPSFFEGLPIALIEAQAAGLPIIASDTITKEVQITNLMTFKRITVEPQRWAKRIDDHLVLFREDISQEIKKAGYDVKDTANFLENYYMAIMKADD